jgi:hypothetical protein
MIWHIFKKDWKLTWPMVAGVAAIHFALRLMFYEMGHFGRPALGSLLNLLLIGGYLGSAFLIVSVVHQDAIPGLRQDWLVRPVPRRDLLLAKILFVLLLVQGPMIAADVFESLLFGFSPSQSLAAALSRGMGLLFFFYLAMLVFASLTRNLTEAIVGGVVVFLSGAGVIVMAQGFAGGHPQLWVEWSGLAWIEQVEQMLLTALVAVAVLGLQYFRRKTLPSRWIFGVAALLWVMIFFTPWQPAFAVQEWASPRPGTAGSVAVAFAAELGNSRATPNMDIEKSRVRIDEGGALVSLPLRITGLPNDSVLKADHYEVRVILADGKLLNAGSGDILEVFHEGPAKSEIEAYQSVRVPASTYDRVKDQPVALQIDYSLTLMKLTGAYGISAVHGEQRTPELGWCKTRGNDERTAVQLRCMRPGNGPNCSTSFLESASTGQRNPAHSGCSSNYSPFVGRLVDAVGRFGVNSPFRDPTGLAQYPLGSQLDDTRMVVRVYRPEDHFTRRVTAPSIRMSDWVVR